MKNCGYPRWSVLSIYPFEMYHSLLQLFVAAKSLLVLVWNYCPLLQKVSSPVRFLDRLAWSAHRRFIHRYYDDFKSGVCRVHGRTLVPLATTQGRSMDDPHPCLTFGELFFPRNSAPCIRLLIVAKKFCFN